MIQSPSVDELETMVAIVGNLEWKEQSNGKKLCRACGSWLEDDHKKICWLEETIKPFRDGSLKALGYIRHLEDFAREAEIKLAVGHNTGVISHKDITSLHQSLATVPLSPFK